MNMKQAFPQKSECESIGKISRPHGGEGFVLVNLHGITPQVFQEFEYVFLDIQDKLVPFFIQNCTLKSNSVYVQFDDITTVPQAEKIASYFVFVPKTFIEAEEPEEIHVLIGFDVYNGKDSVGKITDVIEFSMNTVLQIENDEQQEFLLPFAQELIVTIDEAERKIVMNLPDGIFDLE